MSKCLSWALLTTVVGLIFSAAGCQGPFDEARYPANRIHDDRLRQVDTLQLKPAALGDDEPRPTTDSADPLESLDLSLEESRALALRHNLDLQVQLISPTIARQSMSEAEARFEALLFSGLDLAKGDTPIDTGLSGSQTDSRSADVGLRIPLRTGGMITLDVPVNRSETDNAFSTLNPSYTSDLRASISQPLLRTAGVATNMHAIRVAGYETQQVEARTKLEVIRVLAAVDRVYWRLLAAQRALGVRKQEHELARQQLERARRQVAAGVVAPIEIIRAESGVAERLEAIIVADNDARDRQRELKRVLNKPGAGIGTATVINPSTEPQPIRFALDPKHLAQVAETHRMELLDLELQLAREASSIDFERNQSLPLVNLNYTYNVNGLGPTASDAFDLLFEKRFEDHQLGLKVEVPLGNQAARSRLRRATVLRLQTLARRDQRRTQIRQEVFSAVDRIEATWQRIVANRQRRVLSERGLSAEVRQFEVGMSTSTDVLDAQTRLAAARLAEIVALAEYQIAQVDLAFATGMMLGASKIRWEPAVAPQREN